MKNLATIVLTVFLITGNLYADAGSCVFYQAKFYLKNGSIVKGGFEAIGEYGCDYAYLDDNGNNRYCSDQGILKLIKQLQGRHFYFAGDGIVREKADFGKLPVYTNLTCLETRPFRKNKELPSPELYGFLTANDVTFIDSNDIKRVVFWSAEYSGRNWLTSGIVVGTKGMIDTVQNQRYWNSVTVDMEFPDSESNLLSFSQDAMWGCRLINYNAKINVEGLKEMVRLKFQPRMAEAFSDEFWRKHPMPKEEKKQRELQLQCDQMFERKMQQIRMWFWEKGVVMVRINGTC